MPGYIIATGIVHFPVGMQFPAGTFGRLSAWKNVFQPKSLINKDKNMTEDMRQTGDQGSGSELAVRRAKLQALVEAGRNPFEHTV